MQLLVCVEDSISYVCSRYLCDTKEEGESEENAVLCAQLNVGEERSSAFIFGGFPSYMSMCIGGLLSHVKNRKPHTIFTATFSPPLVLSLIFFLKTLAQQQRQKILSTSIYMIDSFVFYVSFTLTT